MSGTQPPNQEVTATEEGEPPELDAWLAGFGAEALKAELDALGAESVEDIKELDQEDIKLLEVKAYENMKKLKAKKFVKVISELAGNEGDAPRMPAGRESELQLPPQPRPEPEPESQPEPEPQLEPEPEPEPQPQPEPLAPPPPQPQPQQPQPQPEPEPEPDHSTPWDGSESAEGEGSPRTRRLRRSASGPKTRFCEPEARYGKSTFRAYADSNYKRNRIATDLAGSIDWRAQLVYDIDADGPPVDQKDQELQARARTKHAELLSQKRFDELAVLMWTLDARLNLPEVFNDVNEALLTDDPWHLGHFSGFITAVNRYISSHQTVRPVSLFRGTSIRDAQRVNPADAAIFRQPIFAGTTEDHATAAEFAKDGSPIIEYLVPAGCARCTELPSDLSAYPEEKEWLIMPYTAMQFVKQEERLFPPAGIDLPRDVERKMRLVVTFAVVDEGMVPVDAPSHLMVCESSSLFRGAAISVVGRQTGAPVYGRALVISGSSSTVPQNLSVCDINQVNLPTLVAKEVHCDHSSQFTAHSSQRFRHHEPTVSHPQ